MTNHMDTDTQRAWVATRKGLFELARGSKQAWEIVGHSFKGDPVTAILPPNQTNTPMLAALNLGHFGSKLQRSDDQGKTWQEVTAPAYLASADGASLILPAGLGYRYAVAKAARCSMARSRGFIGLASGT